jgi:hypothetical protein
MSSNNEACGKCDLFWPLEKGLKGGKRKALHHGYCLNTTVFATNKVGEPVYPPRAKTAILPNAQHKVTLMRKDEVNPNCQKFTKR